MKKIVLIILFTLSISNGLLFAEDPHSNEKIKLIQYVDSLMSYLCDDVQLLIKNSDFEDFKQNRMDLSNISDSCKGRLNQFYYETNSLYDTEKKLHLYNQLFYFRNYPSIIYDNFIKSIVYEIMNDCDKCKYNSYLESRFIRNIRLLDFKKMYDSLTTLEHIEGRYIPNDLDEAVSLLEEMLDPKDISRIMSYSNDEDCFWGEMDLSARIPRNHWFLFSDSRLSKYLSKNYLDEIPDGTLRNTNGYTLSSILIVSFRNKGNPAYNPKTFVKKLGFYIPFGKYTKPILGEKHEIIIE